MSKVHWVVTVFDKNVPFLQEIFDRRGAASAYTMRWNKNPDFRWRAEMRRVETPREERNQNV